MLSVVEKWDKTTVSLCRELLINALFSKDGANKRDLTSSLEIKSNTTLNTKLNILRRYDLVEEIKEGNTAFYKLKYNNLAAALGTEV